MKVPDSCQACENILRDHRQSLVDKKIWPDQVVIIDNMLERRLELLDSYQELNSKLGPHPEALYVFFDTLLGTADVWHPKEIAEARAARDRLDEVNRKIADVGIVLAELLEERTRLHNTSGFHSDTHYDVLEVIEIAARHNGHFNGWVKEPLARLRHQFDHKYWPSLSEFVTVVADNSEGATSTASDPTTADATDGPRASLYDFLKALTGALRRNTMRNHSFLPDDFRLTDGSLATLVNCALNLSPEDGVGASYVKRWRQREREAARNFQESEDLF